jgi:ABC-type phosphate/phosphonate transport system ATPase subunit
MTQEKVMIAKKLCQKNKLIPRGVDPNSHGRVLGSLKQVYQKVLSRLHQVKLVEKMVIDQLCSGLFATLG